MIDTIFENIMKKNIDREDKDEKDLCQLCGKKTPYSKNTHVDKRYYYTDGGGQLCADCYTKLYG